MFIKLVNRLFLLFLLSERKLLATLMFFRRFMTSRVRSIFITRNVVLYDERYLEMTPIIRIAAVKFPITWESPPSIKLSIKITRHPYIFRTVFVSIREQVDC